MTQPTDYHEETRKRLQASIDHSGLSRYRWSITTNVSTGTVYDVLNNRSVSIKRLNTIRPLLDLPEIELQTVKIDPARQKVVNRQGPAPYVTRQVRLSKKDAELVDGYIRERGYRSFSEWFHAEGFSSLVLGLDTY